MSEERSVVDTLSYMQRQWLEHYIATNGNATEAARQAGYKWPDKVGSQLRQNPKIREALDERMHQLTMSANEVLYLLTQHARSSVEPFIEFETRPEYDPETGEETAVPTGNFWIDLYKAQELGVLHLVKEVKQDKKVYRDKTGGTETTYQTMVKLHDAQTAAIQIGRYYSLWTDNIKEDSTITKEVVHKFDLSGVPFDVLSNLAKHDDGPPADFEEEE